MFEIRIIGADQTYPIRQQILRPGQPLDACQWSGDFDETTRHFGAYKSGLIVGVLSLYQRPHPDKDFSLPYQIRGMATMERVRGLGFGKHLLNAADQYVGSVGGEFIWANARAMALGFYCSLNYKVLGPPFIIEGIGKHYLIGKETK